MRALTRLKNLTGLKLSKTKRFSNLVLENSDLVLEKSHEPAKGIFNFSSHDLIGNEKSLLCKGLHFLIPPKCLDYADHMLPLELLNSDIN